MFCLVLQHSKSLFVDQINNTHTHKILSIVKSIEFHWLTMRLHPNKPIIIWIYCKLKVHLLTIYLTYWASEFNLTYLNMLGTLRLAYSWATSISHKAYLTTKCWISYGILNTVLRVENRMAGWVQNGCKGIGCLSLWSCYWVGAVAPHCCPASCKSVIPHTTSLEDQNSKYSPTECIYCFYIIIKVEKSKVQPS